MNTLFGESPCGGGETKVDSWSRSRSRSQLGGKKMVGGGRLLTLLVAKSSLCVISSVARVWVPMLSTDLVTSHELGPKGRSSSMAGVGDVVMVEAPPALDHMKHKSNKPYGSLRETAKTYRHFKH